MEALKLAVDLSQRIFGVFADRALRIGRNPIQRVHGGTLGFLKQFQPLRHVNRPTPQHSGVARSLARNALVL